ncbi:MAG: EthD family reductase [Actinobacteria bacterium]|nr:EthD family reductase [Actinomycetota bacterium]
MFKIMIQLTRREDMSREEFLHWWLKEHAPRARTLPGVRRITFNVVDPNAAIDADGIAELWFDSEKAFQEAYATDSGAAVAADSVAHVSARIRVPVEEHEIVTDR